MPSYGAATLVNIKKTDSVKSETAGETRRYNHVASDTGDGYIIGETGTINYSTGALVLPVLPDVTESVWNSSTAVEMWETTTGTSTVHSFTSGIVNIYYTPAGATSADFDVDVDVPDITIQLIDADSDQIIVQGSVCFTGDGNRYVDRAGAIIKNPSPATGSGTTVGSIDYQTGKIVITQPDGGLADFALVSLLTKYGDWSSISANFRTQLAPLKPEALSITAVTLDGVQISASADEDGVISGEWMSGSVNYNFGTAKMDFGKTISSVWTPREVDPATIRYNAVSYKYIPLSADILGIDAVRLPSDGRVPIYRAGDLVVIANTDDAAPATISNGGTISAGRLRLAWVRLIDDDGNTVAQDKYALDRAAGTITVPDVAGLSQPLTLRHTVADLRMVTDAQIDGTLTLSRQLSYNFPTTGTVVSGCLLHGDRHARMSKTFDQNTWDGTWEDSQVGSPATATMDFISHPIVVTNAGAETERWVLRFTSQTNVELIGETRGLVFSGAFNADIAPINPRTKVDGVGGVPYLVIPVAANGGGWSAGNIVRINTVGAIAPIWIARSIMQSDEPAGDGEDGCEIYSLGNVDRP